MSGRGHVFDDLKKLNEMIALREKGVSPSVLGRKYNVDHSTIIYHSQKAGIQSVITVSGVVQVIKKVPRVTISVSGTVRYDEDGSRINPGRNYAEYLEEAERRRWNQLLEGGKIKGTDGNKQT